MLMFKFELATFKNFVTEYKYDFCFMARRYDLLKNSSEIVSFHFFFFFFVNFFPTKNVLMYYCIK